MSNRPDRPRIFLAVTENSPLSELWRAVEQHRAETHAELVAFYIDDESWLRAASLPFTREFSRFGGARKDFTQHRAAQIGADIAGEILRRMRELAAQSNLRFEFEVLRAKEVRRLHKLVRIEHDIFIVPSHLKDKPVSAELMQLKCRTLFIESEDTERDQKHPDTAAETA